MGIDDCVIGIKLLKKQFRNFMKKSILGNLRSVKEEIERIIERDIDTENDVRENLADPEELEKYVKDLERLSKTFEDLAKEVANIISEGKFSSRGT